MFKRREIGTSVRCV